MADVEVVNIETLDQFVRAIQHWHGNKVQVLKHMMNIPEGTEVTEDKSSHTLVLTGDVLKAFQYGIEVALSELGELPFEASVDFTSSDQIISDSAGTTH